jgi:hypothetical protein
VNLSLYGPRPESHSFVTHEEISIRIGAARFFREVGKEDVGKGRGHGDKPGTGFFTGVRPKLKAFDNGSILVYLLDAKA